MNKKKGNFVHDDYAVLEYYRRQQWTAAGIPQNKEKESEWVGGWWCIMNPLSSHIVLIGNDLGASVPIY